MGTEQVEEVKTGLREELQSPKKTPWRAESFELSEPSAGCHENQSTHFRNDWVGLPRHLILHPSPYRLKEEMAHLGHVGS